MRRRRSGRRGVATFVLWTAMPLTAAPRPGPRWYRRISAVLGMAAGAAFVVAGATTRADSADKGLAQRSFLAPVFAWHLATAARS